MSIIANATDNDTLEGSPYVAPVPTHRPLLLLLAAAWIALVLWIGVTHWQTLVVDEPVELGER